PRADPVDLGFGLKVQTFSREGDAIGSGLHALVHLISRAENPGIKPRRKRMPWLVAPWRGAKRECVEGLSPDDALLIDPDANGTGTLYAVTCSHSPARKS